MENIQRVRRGLALFSDEELWEEKLGPKAVAAKAFEEEQYYPLDYQPDMIKFAMRNCYIADSTDCWLYDHEGEAIDTPRHLHNALTKWDTLYTGEANPYNILKVFVVPADVHY